MGAERWQARWIWCAPPAIRVETATRPVLAPEAPDRFALLRRALVLDRLPARAPTRVVADSRYVLFVNGAEIARGPARANPRRLRHDTVDLAPHLVPGDNVIAALVRFYGHAMPWWMPAPPTYTLGAGSFALETHLPDGWVLTDETWRALPGSGWRSGTPDGIGAGLAEVLDGRILDPMWTTASFDDRHWAPAHVIAPVHVGAVGAPVPPSTPYGALAPSPLPVPVGERRDAAAVAVVRVGGGAAHDDPVRQVDADERSPAGKAAPVTLHTFDFGEVVAGIVTLSVDGPSGTRLDVSFAEALDEDGRLVRLGQHTGVRYTARGGADTFISFDPIGARVARLAVRAPDSHTVGVRLCVRERHRPRLPGPFFRCSDPVLTRAYEVGLRTVDLCAQDAYLDCPTREQRAWTGDAVVHQMVDLTANADWSLARWHPQLAASPRADGMLPMAAACDFEHDDRIYIPDWALHWIRMVHNLYRYTADDELVSSLMPVAEGVLRWFEPFQGDDGLLRRVTGWVLIDWSSVHVADTSAALTGLWARGLNDLADMAEWLDDRRAARWARAAWARVAAGYDAFWDGDRGVYVDHLVDGERRPPLTRAANAAAVVGGLVPEDRRASVVAWLTDRHRRVQRSWVMDRVTPESERAGETGAAFASLVGPPPPPDWDVESEIVDAEPFFRSVVHDAVAIAGRAELVADLCRDWSVFLERGETTWPETWRGGTHCHGWSSTPTPDLIVHTLGITPATPGYASVAVAPRLGDLTWADGAAPTPHGLVTVTAERAGITLDSPVPVVADLGAGTVRELPPGRHVIGSPSRRLDVERYPPRSDRS